MRKLLPLWVLIVLAGCQKDTHSGATDDPNVVPEQTLLNQSYGSDPQQVLDAYLPAGRSADSTRVIILIHGGAWSSGDKSDFGSFVDTLKRRLPSYAIFNINYRLATVSSNLFPTQENDVRAAYDYIVGKTQEYKISNKMVILGASAGAHLALLQGYKNSTIIKPKAIVDFFGPTDLVDLHDHPGDPTIPIILEILLAGTPTSNASLYQQSSPVNFVSGQCPPTIVLQGGLDPLVPVAQATSLIGKLQSEGVPNEYVFYPGEGHGWFGASLSDSFNAIQAFLTAHVN